MGRSNWSTRRNAARNRLAIARAYFPSGAGETGRFLVVTSGRTGSELLMSLLASHPQIDCDSELLGEKRLDPFRLLEGKVARAAAHQKAAYGFKVKPKDIYEVQHVETPSGFIRTLAGSGWTVIRLGRADWLQQAISAIRASLTQWHYRVGESLPFVPLSVDPYLVIANMCTIAYYERQIDELLRDVEHLTLTYEKDLRDPEQQEATGRLICELLGVPHQPMTSDLIRVNPTETRHMVENYDELAEIVRRNEFAGFFDSEVVAPTD